MIKIPVEGGEQIAEFPEETQRVYLGTQGRPLRSYYFAVDEAEHVLTGYETRFKEGHSEAILEPRMASEVPKNFILPPGKIWER